MVLGRLLWLSALVVTMPLHAAMFEPKEVKSVRQIGAGDGFVRLSLRTQRQFIETAYLYFVQIKPDGSDGERIVRFERGAGVPLMGTNMIDVKPKYYAVPAGKYRLLAYTVACGAIPGPRAVCSFYGHDLPTGHYGAGSPTFEVASGKLTDAGDFVIEYVREADLDNFDLFSERFSVEGYGIRWRPIKALVSPDFAGIGVGVEPIVPAEFHSRIECDERPKNKSVQFPFKCPPVAQAR
jgi:hypothetical protein